MSLALVNVVVVLLGVVLGRLVLLVAASAGNSLLDEIHDDDMCRLFGYLTEIDMSKKVDKKKESCICIWSQ